MPTRCGETIESGGLGSPGRSARPTSTMRKLIIALALIYCAARVAGNSNRSIGKCCPCGQVISVAENFTCAFAEDHSREIYQFQGHGGHEQFPKCPESGNLTLARLEDVADGTLGESSACIDMMYDEVEDTSVPVMFRCAANGSGEDAAGTGSLAVPRPPALRMCCGIDQVYDDRKRDCVFKKDGLNVPKNFRFLNGSLDFVSVVRGTPPCQTAVLDYAVDDARDVLVHEDGTLKVRRDTLLSTGVTGIR